MCPGRWASGSQKAKIPSKGKMATTTIPADGSIHQNLLLFRRSFCTNHSGWFSPSSSSTIHLENLQENLQAHSENIKAVQFPPKDDQRSTRVLSAYYQRTPCVLPATISVPALLQRLFPPTCTLTRVTQCHHGTPTEKIQGRQNNSNNCIITCNVETWPPSMSRP